MRRLLTIVLLTAFVAWTVPAMAINAKSKTKDPKQTESKPSEQAKPQIEKPSGGKSSDLSKNSLLNKLRRQVTESKSKPVKYDQFQDSNKDGVSDKVQRQRPAAESAPAAEPQPAQKDDSGERKTTRTKDTSEKKKGDDPKR